MTKPAGNTAPRISQQSARHRFLLVVDSDAGRLFHTASILKRLQYNVWTVQTGAEALEMATTALPASIITTLRLRDMTGVNLIKQIKREDETKSIAIFVLADEKDPLAERACLAAGAVTCLPLPFQPEALYRMMQVALETMPRMNIRIPAMFPVTVNNRRIDCIGGDCASMLSEHGLFIRTKDPLPLNTKLTVAFRLAAAAITAEAVVVFCQKSGEDPGMGVQFLRIDPQDQTRIRKFIREQLIG